MFVQTKFEDTTLSNRFGLLQLIWVTLISQFLVVLAEVEKVKARVAVSVAKFPIFT